MRSPSSERRSCAGSLWVYTATRGAAFAALCRRAASGEPISIQALSAPVRSRTAIAGSSGSASPREKAMPSAYSRQYARTRVTRYSSLSDGCFAALSSSVSYTPRSTSLNRIVKWWIVAVSAMAKCRAREVASLEREGEAGLAVSAVALTIGSGIAVDVRLVHRAESKVSVAPDLQIGARAAADGIEIVQAFDAGAPVEGADIGLHVLDLIEDVLHRRRDLGHLRVGSGPRFEEQAYVEAIEKVVARPEAEHEIALIEGLAGAGGGHQVRPALAEPAGDADALSRRRRGERECCRGQARQSKPKNHRARRDCRRGSSCACLRRAPNRLATRGARRRRAPSAAPTDAASSTPRACARAPALPAPSPAGRHLRTSAPRSSRSRKAPRA